MINFRAVLKQEGLSEGELSDKAKRFIVQYDKALQEVESLKNSKVFSIRNAKTGEFTISGLEKFNSAKERAEDYNERILDEIADFIQEKTQDNQDTEIIDKGIAQPIKEDSTEQKQTEEEPSFWWARR